MSGVPRALTVALSTPKRTFAGPLRTRWVLGRLFRNPNQSRGYWVVTGAGPPSFQHPTIFFHATFFHATIRPHLALLALSLGSLTAAPAVGAELDYEALAKAALERHGQADSMPETFTFDDFAKQGFVHLEVGLFDLYMEQDAFANGTDAKRFLNVAASLAVMQAAWLNWVDPVGAEIQTQRKVALDLASELGKAQVGTALSALSKLQATAGDGVLTETVDLAPLLGIKAEKLPGFRDLAQYLQVSGGSDWNGRPGASR